MVDRNQEKLKYELGIHHRQNMRQHIDPKMIDNLEISDTPSRNYDQAYKALYLDELQKSVDLFNHNKTKEKLTQNYEAEVGKMHQNVYGPNQHDVGKQSFSKLQETRLHPVETTNLNYRNPKYENYDQLKEGKALDYTYNNYDGGKKFHQDNDLHAAYQASEKEKMRRTLQRQIEDKGRVHEKESLRVKKEGEAIQGAKQVLMEKEKMKEENRKENMNQHTGVILKQMEEEKVRRGRRSLFNYDNHTRHNPITNPIERRIDNPYILKQMQNQSQQDIHRN